MWPISQPSSEVKQLVNRFFTLVDTNSQEAGKTLADTIFTNDEVFITANGTFQGAAEISQSRANAWTTVKFRRHTIWKCYVNDAYGTDIFIVGNLEMETLAGTKANLEFVARMKIQQQEPGHRVCKYQVVSPAPQDSRSIVDAK
ncbi:uncharacterized protein TRUGW13939_11858 [Talaromyces rugulosus]|uniref:SnoaL-like domain-containing protein n=1 Tax=Talaromyces rugulosus TaxID=121627 RepID=A0A7H8RDV8_TALRU|nr:uncharacterized protein TRUGW13939_11858 [Talaromyces rugulosus]QKX64682.1 hypothetical protein TRUGW13939_11858 [Talaromyces rugulosus]